MAFDQNMNNVTVTLATYPSDAGSQVEASCQIENVPLQSWTNLIMTLNGNALDCYLDGKLVRTCVLSGVPKMDKKAPLYLCPGKEGFKGFSGYTSKLRYYLYSKNSDHSLIEKLFNELKLNVVRKNDLVSFLYKISEYNLII